MTDLDQFLALINKTRSSYATRTQNLHTAGATILVEVMPGYRCHFEAEFDDDDNIVSMGQWDEM